MVLEIAVNLKIMLEEAKILTIIGIATEKGYISIMNDSGDVSLLDLKQQYPNAKFSYHLKMKMDMFQDGLQVKVLKIWQSNKLMIVWRDNFNNVKIQFELFYIQTVFFIAKSRL